MEAKIETLICLQQVDEEILKATAELTALPSRITELEGRLQRRQKDVAAVEQKVREEDTWRRRLESDLQDPADEDCEIQGAEQQCEEQ